MISLHRRDLLTGALTGLLTIRTARSATAQASAVIDAAVAAVPGFFGVIVTATAGRTDISSAFGKADIEAGEYATAATPYGIGSISKWLTSLTLLRLADAGVIDIDAPIGELLPGYRRDTGAKVRLTHLLSNTSGIPDGFLPRAKTDETLWTQPFTTEEAVKAFCSGDLTFEPGSKFEYLFTNWVLVRAIIESVTGEDYIAVMRRVTLDPLKLFQTGPITAYAGSKALAPAYESIDPPVRKMRPYRPYGLASGGYVSTAGDLIAAAQGVYGGGFLSEHALARLSAVTVPDQHYAMGGRTRPVAVRGRTETFAWQTGRVEGYRSVLAYGLTSGRSVAILNNTDVSQKAMDLLALEILGGTFAD